MKFLSLFVILLFVGCASFAEIHKFEPDKTLNVYDKSPEQIANCVTYEAKTRGFNAVLTQKDDSFVLFLSRTYIEQIPFGEITFKPQDKGTYIEIRSFGGYGVRKSWPLECVIPCISPKKKIPAQ